jgi:hypothetical protein
MKALLPFFFTLTISTTAFASEVYNCEFTGPNYLLTFHDNSSITLSNQFKSYTCQKSYENFPGTELEMTTLVCKSGSDQQQFYFTVMNEDQIILSKGFVFSKDITCSKIQN